MSHLQMASHPSQNCSRSCLRDLALDTRRYFLRGMSHARHVDAPDRNARWRPAGRRAGFLPHSCLISGSFLAPFLDPFLPPFWVTFGGPVGAVFCAKHKENKAFLGIWELPKGLNFGDFGQSASAGPRSEIFLCLFNCISISDSG